MRQFQIYEVNCIFVTNKLLMCHFYKFLFEYLIEGTMENTVEIWKLDKPCFKRSNTVSLSRFGILM